MQECRKNLNEAGEEEEEEEDETSGGINRNESSLDEVVQVDRSCSVLQVSVSKYIHNSWMG